MAHLKNNVVNKTLEHIRVVYIGKSITSWWNVRRSNHDTKMFTGWYWLKGSQEGGPFKTQSAAIRDAYYKFVLKQTPPNAGQTYAQHYMAENRINSNWTPADIPVSKVKQRRN